MSGAGNIFTGARQRWERSSCDGKEGLQQRAEMDRWADTTVHIHLSVPSRDWIVRCTIGLSGWPSDMPAGRTERLPVGLCRRHGRAAGLGVPTRTRLGVAKHNLPHLSFTSHHLLPGRDWRVGYTIGPVFITVLACNSARQVTAAVTQRAQDQCTRAYNAAAKVPASSEGQAGQTSGPAKGFLAERCCRSSSVWYIDQVLDGPPRGIHLHLWPFSGSLPNCPPALELSNRRTATSQRHLLPESMAVVAHPYLEDALSCR